MIKNASHFDWQPSTLEVTKYITQEIAVICTYKVAVIFLSNYYLLDKYVAVNRHFT